MTTGTLATICVNYRNIEGYHVFTSDDVYGLYVASKDPLKAFKSVAPSLQKLVKLNYKIDITVEPADSFQEFRRSILSEPVAVPHPAILESCNFVVRRTA